MRIVAPKRRPQEFDFRPGDYHLVVNSATMTAKAYTYEGKLMWEIPCLTQGQHADWRLHAGDTPPGLYKFGQIWRDYETETTADDSTAYGWFTVDMIDLEGNEDGNGRAGIAIHGGGTALGWRGSWEPNHRLVPTLGCIRCRNIDLRDKVIPLKTANNVVYVSVYQYAV